MLMFTMAACKNETTETTVSKPKINLDTPEARAKMERIRSVLQGEWAWDDRPNENFVVTGDRCYYAQSGSIKHRDTLNWFLSIENPNPPANYHLAARMFNVGPIIYFRTENHINGANAPTQKNAYVLLDANPGYMQWINTETGIVWNYKKVVPAKDTLK